MTDQLISFETAKLAKEKGFDELVRGVYNHLSDILIYCHFKNSQLKPYERDPLRNEIMVCTASTQSLLQKYLREKHNIHINPQAQYRLKGNYIYGVKINEMFFDGYVKYEEALEAGLQEGLKLIK